MKRLSIFIASIALFAAGCGSDSPASPSDNPNQTVLRAILSPANEVPPVTNAESTVQGTATITLDTNKDGSGNVTSATATFAVNLTGIPAGSSINIAHIHEGAATCQCPVVVNTTLAAGQAAVSGGGTQFQKENIPVAAELAQRIISNPSAFYFNVHSTLNPGGVARGTLVKQ
jgi:hypothetical protein